MSQKVKIGELRERVQIQRVTNTRDSMGAIIETWATLATVWAKVEPKSAGEQWRREQIQASADWTVTVRYSETYRPSDRIVWRGRTLQIVGVENPDMRRRFAEIACRELQVSQTQVTALP